MITHTRVRWTSTKGVEFAPLDYDKYPASEGWTDIRYFEIDLNEYEMDVPIEPHKTIAQFAKEEDAEIVVNGSFAYEGKPLGHIVKDGKIVNDTVVTAPWIDFILRDKPSIEQLDPKNISDIILSFAGTPQIVRDGKIYVSVWVEKTPKDVYANRRPRTGLGIKKDGTLVICIVDGDSKWDAGLTVAELGRVMIELGAYNAMNLDGGGSSCVAQNGKVISANKGLRQLGSALTFKRKNKGLVKVNMISSEHDNNSNMEPKGLTVHTTANRDKGASAIMHDRYYDNNSDRVSVHWTVDNIHAVQSVPENKAAWHAGNREYNLTYIGMEICENNVVNEKLDSATYSNAILLTADILNRHGWGIDKMIQHRDVPGREWKNCPNTNLINWDKFKSEVQQKLNVAEVIEKPNTSELESLIKDMKDLMARAENYLKGVK